jgi:hypothetical protein
LACDGRAPRSLRASSRYFEFTTMPAFNPPHLRCTLALIQRTMKSSFEGFDGRSLLISDAVTRRTNFSGGNTPTASPATAPAAATSGNSTVPGTTSCRVSMAT